MRSALQAIVGSARNEQSNLIEPPKDVLDAIIESSRGDIRSAINSLEFICSRGSAEKTGVKKNKRNLSRAMLEIVTRRENSLVLFHLLGKILYNKRLLILIHE
jgi:cell cycle checkpoint protein